VRGGVFLGEVALVYHDKVRNRFSVEWNALAVSPQGPFFKFHFSERYRVSLLGTISSFTSRNNNEFAFVGSKGNFHSLSLLRYSRT